MIDLTEGSRDIPKMTGPLRVIVRGWEPDYYRDALLLRIIVVSQERMVTTDKLFSRLDRIRTHHPKVVQQTLEREAWEEIFEALRRLLA